MDYLIMNQIDNKYYFDVSSEKIKTIKTWCINNIGIYGNGWAIVDNAQYGIYNSGSPMKLIIKGERNATLLRLIFGI